MRSENALRMKCCTALNRIVIGVADLDAALALWTGELGLALRGTQEGPDSALARLWSMEADAIRRQALAGMPAARYGLIHLVEFADAGPPVRASASPTDLCPKSIDVYTENLPDRMRELRTRGFLFRNEAHSEVTSPDGLRFREAHMSGHDAVNIVLLEVIEHPVPVTAKGFAAAGLLITIVPDADAETSFCRDVLGLDALMENRLQGPDIEAMIGLPPGAALDVRIWGDASEPMGRWETIEYRGAPGENLYTRARPGATGILHAGFDVPDLAGLRRRLEGAGIPYAEHGTVDSFAISGATISFLTPAGMRIEATEVADRGSRNRG